MFPTTGQEAGTTRVTTPNDFEIRIERVFDAPRDRVWRAYTDPTLLTQWWGRGNRVDIERFELKRGGHWRFVEHGPEGTDGFEGRFAEVVPQERITQTFEWDGMPGYPSFETATFEPLGLNQTKLVTTSRFYTTAMRDGMLGAGMEQGLDQSYAALDKLLTTLH